MQVDDVDCYGASHIVMTGTVKKMMNNITLILLYLQRGQKNTLLFTSAYGDFLYITLPCGIKFSIIKHDYKERKVFDIFITYSNRIKPQLLDLIWIKRLAQK